MSFKFSRCVCLQTPDMDKAVEFYSKILGLKIVHREEGTVEMKAEPFKIFLDKGEFLGPIMEFLVPDVENARKELLEAGCQIVRWEGKGGCCYVRDPFGFVFNVYEEPDAFQSETVI